MSRRGCRVMESVRLPNNAELERWCRAKILAALDRWQDEEISRRLATEPKNANGGAENRVVLLTRKHLRINGFSPGRSIAERWD